MKIMVIPDTQVKPDQSVEFLKWIGQYAADKMPDVIVQIGDFADFPSLSSYDVGKKSFEGRTYKADVLAARAGMKALMKPIRDKQNFLKKNHKPRWNPRLVLTLGNHEERVLRAIEYDRKLDGLISIDDLAYEAFGWEVYPFLEVVVIEGIAFSHYFTSGVMGRPVTTAPMLLTKKHMSCFAGHQQGRAIAYGKRADGKDMTCIIAGSCYQHGEGYLGPQGNEHWRGFYVLHDVRDGSFDEMAVSLKYLEEKYGCTKA
jgi:hypothetical protein